jgi:hypothetical protein
VNFVWNFNNQTSFHAIRDHGKWLSSAQLDKLTAGASKELGLHSQTIQFINQEYVLVTPVWQLLENICMLGH